MKLFDERILPNVMYIHNMSIFIYIIKKLRSKGHYNSHLPCKKIHLLHFSSVHDEHTNLKFTSTMNMQIR